MIFPQKSERFCVCLARMDHERLAAIIRDLHLP